MDLSDEDTRAEFAWMREAALREVVVPGAQAAHRTVRGRRRRVAVASSGLAVLALAGGIALAQPKPPPAPQAQPQLAVPPAAALVPLAEVTAGALAPFGEGTPPPPERVRMVFKDKGFTGPVRFSILCSGTGTGRATLATEKDRTTATVTCGTPPVATPIALDPGPGATFVDMWIDWDPGAKLIETPEGWALQVLGEDRR